MESPSRIGNYAIEKTLGQGGVGKVYLARDEVLGRRVVVKVLHNIMDSEAKRRFLEEARAQSTLNHPNIVQIYGWGEEESTPYLVMEWVEGEDLHQALEHGRIADLRQKLMVAFQIAKALEHIHAHGIVHRDIKPENIYIDRSGQAKLLDFGISKRDNSGLTQVGYTLGTPSYMAPEQLQGTGVDARTDIYSFGILLY